MVLTGTASVFSMGADLKDAELRRSGDFAEGMQSFAERRPPEYTGG